jgi:hypothetical protein
MGRWSVQMHKLQVKGLGNSVEDPLGWLPQGKGEECAR